MILLERNSYFEKLNFLFEKLGEKDGQCVCITGEAGIGKTSVVNQFIDQVKNHAHIYEGACDFLFSARPLGPLYDIANLLHLEIFDLLITEKDRNLIFSRVLHEFSKKEVPVVVVFEDIHWADEATLDFIKFLARRIHKIQCLFLLTFRDDEIFHGHPLRNVLRELPSETFTKLKLDRLSKTTVHDMARDLGYSGDDIFRVTGGNPFFVKEILAHYNSGIPENIKDLVLSIFFKQTHQVRDLWEIISIFPSGLDQTIMGQLIPDYLSVIEPSLSTGILVWENQKVYFKHDLYRSVLYDALSALKRITLHKNVLQYLLTSRNIDLTNIVHHAKNAHHWQIVEEYAPRAAAQAKMFGSHQEAAKLYATAIEYTSFKGKELADLFEKHAYECYLTNHLNDAIASVEKALEIWQHENKTLKIGACFRFISRFSWFVGKRDIAEDMALKAIGVLEPLGASRELATAYSNYAQLKMLSDDKENCLFWGEKTLAIAEDLKLFDIKSHILNNIGCVQILDPTSKTLGEKNLKLSLDIALKYGFQEHAARAYTNLGTSLAVMMDYALSETWLEEGLKYCNDNDLDSWSYYKLSWKARLLLEKGKWREAEEIAQKLLNNPTHPDIVKMSVLVVLGTIKMREGNEKTALTLFYEAKTKALMMKELQRTVPLTCALLEYEWIYKKRGIADEMVAFTSILFETTFNIWYYSQFVYWMYQSGRGFHPIQPIMEPFHAMLQNNWHHAASSWRQKECGYHEALCLIHGDEQDQRKALEILDILGASATLKHLRKWLRNKGIKNVPRGKRPTTKENSALLTTRQIEVLYLLKDGLQNNEIADRLFISYKTVDHHLTAIFSKLHVNSRTKAVAEAINLGILK